MARYTGPVCKLCRRDGSKLFLKGTKCISEKCILTRRKGGRGFAQYGSKMSYYALQLREKQKTKRSYGMLERQFKRFFNLAAQSKGVTGAVLLQLLERRLDNVIYRAGFALSRAQARQMVSHRLLSIKGRIVNIPSYLVSPGEEIVVKANARKLKLVKENMEIISKERSIPSWLELDKNNLKIKVLRMPQKDDITLPVNEQLIVELYSR